MSRDALFFERLFVRRMPGVEDGFTLDELSPGLNVVHGPNASGKTTTARAIESLLWPRAAAPERAVLGGRFTLAGETWGIEVDAGRARWQREGREATSPALPPADTRDRYRLSLHELLSSDNSSLAAEIVRESAGGYDVAAAARALHCRAGASRAPAEAKAYEAARRALREARERQDVLRGDEARLVELRNRIEAAEAAARRARLLERAVEAAEAATVEREAREALAQFPAAMVDLTGTEADRLAALRQARDEAEARLAEATREAADAAALRDTQALPDGGVPPETIAALRGRVERLRELLHIVQQRADEFAAANKGRAEAAGRFDGTVDEERLDTIDVASLKEMAAFAREYAELEARAIAADEEARRLAEDADAAEDTERLEDAARLLRRWLRAGTETPTGERRVRALGLVATMLLFATALAAGLLALQLPPLATWAPVATLALVITAVTLAVGIARRGRSVDPRAVHRAEFERLGVEAPGKWTDDDVVTHLTELERRLARATLAAERARRREDAERKREALEPAWRALEEKRETLAAALGVEPATDPQTLHWLVERVSRWHDAAGRAREAEAALAEARARFAEEFAAARDDLAPYALADVRDVPALAAAVDALASRDEAYRRAADRAAAAEHRTVEARAAIARAEEERRGILERLGLEDDDEATVTEWCARLEAYRDARDAVVAAERRARDAMTRLTETDGYEQGLEARGVDELRDEWEAAAREAEEAQTLRDEAARIEERIALAKSAHDVETALADLARAEDALREARATDEFGVVGQALVDFVQRETRDQHRPEVFHRARELFLRVTHGRYRLDFDDGDPPAFRAYDTTTATGHALDELSSATRVQLLLAVRLAFVERQEAGVRLPLLLDETLGNSDDARAAAIIDAVLALAAEGRQVFYFTAQPDEVGKWKGVLAERPEIPARFVDLARARNWGPRATSLAIVDAPTATIPAPQGRSHEEYGSLLGVPPLDPHAPVERVHLWHLVDEPDALHRLLTLGIERWGALQALVEHGGLDALGDAAPVFPRARATARALEVAFEAARIGRGKPVDREVLRESGAVTDRFLDRVADLCEACGGNAALLLEALEAGRVERFRRAAIDALRDYFEANGYLDPREKLDPETVRARVLGAVAAEIRAGVIGAEVVGRAVAIASMT